jgi:hypothetical protein
MQVKQQGELACQLPSCMWQAMPEAVALVLGSTLPSLHNCISQDTSRCTWKTAQQDHYTPPYQTGPVLLWMGKCLCSLPSNPAIHFGLDTSAASSESLRPLHQRVVSYAWPDMACGMEWLSCCCASLLSLSAGLFDNCILLHSACEQHN